MQSKLIRFSLGLLALVLMTAPCLTFAQSTIKIGFYPIKPHIFFHGKRVTGAATEYWHKYLEPEMNIQIEWYGPLTLKRLMVYLKLGVVQAAAIIPQDQTGENYLIPAKSPLYASRSALLVMATAKLKSVHSAGDIAGLNIGFTKDQSPTAFITRNQIPLKRFTGKDWVLQNMTALAEKKLDAVYFSEEYLASYYIKGLNLTGKVREIPLPEKEVKYYTAFSKAKGKQFVEPYEQAIHKINLNDIKYTDLLNKYIK